VDFSIRLDLSSSDLAIMLPQCSHITRKRGVYYYRRRLPQHPTRELTLSLRTRSFREAQWLAAKLDEEFTVIMSSVKNHEQPADIQRIAREYLKSRLETDMELRVDSPHVGVYSRSTEPGQIVADDLEWVEGELLGARARLRDRLYDHEWRVIDGVMEHYGVPQHQRNALAHAIYQADVAFWETVIQRTKGNFTPEPNWLQSIPSVEMNGAAVGGPSPSPTPAPTAASGPLFSTELLGFIKLMEGTEGWRGQTLAQNKATYRMFVECCGDRPVAEYQRIDLAKFYDILRALPKLYAKSREWRGLTRKLE
jgi:hypothetical protein